MKKSDLHKLIKESMPGYPEDRFAATAQKGYQVASRKRSRSRRGNFRGR